MLILAAPSVRVHASFLAAMAEFESEGRGHLRDDSMLGREMREHGRVWDTPEGFAQYVQTLYDQAREQTPRPEGFVPSTTLWWMGNSEYLGRLTIRHRLTPFLRDVGGHVGYDVRPSARRQGHATAMLQAALPEAYGLGIDPVLVTCDEDNVASRKVIERGGGIFDNRHGEKLRFWVPAS